MKPGPPLEYAVLNLLVVETCLHQMLPCLIKRAAVLLSQSDNYVTITPSAKVVNIIFLVVLLRSRGNNARGILSLGYPILCQPEASAWLVAVRFVGTSHFKV